MEEVKSPKKDDAWAARTSFTEEPVIPESPTDLEKIKIVTEKTALLRLPPKKTRAEIKQEQLEQKKAEEESLKNENIRKKKKILLFLVILLVIYDIIMISCYYYLESQKVPTGYSTDNIIIINNTINFSSLTLNQKLAQMVIIYGVNKDPEIMKMNPGGVYLFADWSRAEYRSKTTEFSSAKITPFITTDMEGYLNPFKLFYTSKKFASLQNVSDAESLGKEHGAILKELGFNLNLAPVAEEDGKIWPGRGLNGSFFEIADKAKAYLLGLKSQGILGTAKHYPGGSMDSADPHKSVVEKEVRGKELFPFLSLLKDTDAVMIGHVIVTGEINSNNTPCTVSPGCISTLRKNNFKGMIMSDEISMDGLSSFYKDRHSMYLDLINAGNDMILDFSLTPGSFDKTLKQLEYDINNGTIKQSRIDESVIRILKAKGYNIQ